MIDAYCQILMLIWAVVTSLPSPNMRIFTIQSKIDLLPLDVNSRYRAVLRISIIPLEMQCEFIYKESMSYNQVSYLLIWMFVLFLKLLGEFFSPCKGIMFVLRVYFQNFFIIQGRVFYLQAIKEGPYSMIFGLGFQVQLVNGATCKIKVV